MPHKIARPEDFYVRTPQGLVVVRGWASSYALGIGADQDTFASIGLMGGLILARGFASVEQAHAFNLAVLKHSKLFIGTPSAEEMYSRAGGRELFEAEIARLQKEVMKAC